MMKKSLFSLVVITGLCLPRAAQALCLGLALQGVPSTVTFQGGAGEYNVFDPSEHMQTVNFTVLGGASVLSCSYFVTLDTGQSGTATQREMILGGDTLDYNAYTTVAKTNILRDEATAGAANVVAGVFNVLLGLGQTAAHSFYWTIDPLQIVPADAARYQDASVTLRLYAGTITGAHAQWDQKTITFRAKSESSVDLALVDSGGGFDIGDTSQTVDFGDLTSGEMLSFDTLVRSNDGYSVAIQSQNGQQMRHANYPGIGDTVPYSLTFGGAGVNLSSGLPVTAASDTGVTPAGGDRFATDVTVGTLDGGEAAGVYEDILTVTVSAN